MHIVTIGIRGSGSELRLDVKVKVTLVIAALGPINDTIRGKYMG